ncbi:DUF4097 family beta strand repeat-containing protein [Spongiimicrobium salis]|uniref:hypothetical protein n=1 Tax=Spongiimicrobium salis TaxID=1667022 RepID=UPI00374CF202
MKKSILILFILWNVQLEAQKTLEREIPIGRADHIMLTLPYARTIKVHSWQKNEILLKASVRIDNGKLDDHFNLDIKERSNGIRIKSSYGRLFKKQKKSKGIFSNKDRGTTIKMDGDTEHDEITINGIPIHAEYVLYAPENIALTVKSTAGNLTITSFDGNLIADIISGNITINQYNGDMTLKTISGHIAMKIGKALSLKAETTIGKIKKEGQIPKIIIGEKLIGSFAQGNFDQGLHDVELSTVSGNIRLIK